ncbi:DivIVA domain-containing protein [Clostridium frigidicarnis]|uniref:Cell division initiation protein n=1 Tax=Clostridium frigidicarnis TaxID=84698 RepID=A0A1I0WJA2_9CLOT|nr:DivIVA domain-containing protein [Clostridium frigidicarnis]SFA88210.1 cell division initiation protein [Clostridium frigidicarnis]
MKITPMDINNKEFKRIIRGYNPEEVDEFLDKVVEDYESLFKENAALKEKIAAMNERIEYYTKIEATIQNTLVLAQNAAEQAKDSAKKEAEFVIRNANDTAQKIIDKAHNDVMQVTQEYDKMKQEFIKFRAKFRNFMQIQLETFDDLEKDFVKNYNVGSPIEKEIEEKEIELGEPITLNLNEVNEEDFKKDDLEAIKSFFIKDES